MKSYMRIALWAFAGLVFLVVTGVMAALLAMSSSLPALDGSLQLTGLSAPARIARDENGTATVRVANDLDAARALGFVHGQERFFEMDLARRAAAGELSALLGKATLDMDKSKRHHRMRARLTALYARASTADKAVLTAYTEGVNSGLGSLGARPWQYWVLRTTPQPWSPVDSMLVTAEMTFMLQGRSVDERLNEIGLRNMVGDALFAWLKPSGGAWDAALDGSSLPLTAIPSAARINTRDSDEKMVARQWPREASVSEAEQVPGSNNWAVGGAATADGVAILADDMHLGIGVPSIWYRAQLEIGTPNAVRRIAGVTLPGVPGMVVGSNGDVAWGFTNSYGQWFEVVAHAKSKVGPADLTTIDETIDVKGHAPVMLKVREAPWGPVVASDKQHDYSLWWTMYRDGGVNVESYRLLHARSVDEAVGIAQSSGIPHQNLVVADRNGNIAWTIMGRIPARGGVPRASSRARAVPAEGASALPDGWLAPEHYPLIKNPANARLWTANSRQAGGALGAIIGEGGFDLGARAKHIRDKLDEKPRWNEADLYALQLDDEGRFMKRWVELALRIARLGNDPKSTALASELAKWNGRAGVDQTAYRIARAFRVQTFDVLWEHWLKAARRRAANDASELVATDKVLKLGHDSRFEYPVWQALESQGIHLLPLPHQSWDGLLVAQLHAVYDELVAQTGSLDKATWGERNTTRFKHPFSRAMPFLSRFLDMPALPQAGDNHMPRVAGPTFGASQRLVVAPGKEERGILTVAGGQSGHPLSQFYGAGNLAWYEGNATPLLAGSERHALRLTP
jgi:penicillin amidase